MDDFRPGWHRRARCRGLGTELFIPSRGVPTVVRAKALCRECPVREECLAFALSDPELVGVWGGTTVKERSALRAAARKESA